VTISLGGRTFGVGARTVAAVAVVSLVAAAAWWSRTAADSGMVATVERGELVATLTSSGTIRPIQSITYRSPVPGREVEIRDLAPEGTRVNKGDLLVRLGTTDLEIELDRIKQDLRQATMDLQVAEGEWEEAGATVRDVTEGEGALSVQEARSVLQRAEKKAVRLRQEFEHMQPLMDKGFITRDELAKSRDALDEAEDELSLARKRTEILVQMAHPREQKRAALQLSQKSAQLGHARTRVAEAQNRAAILTGLIEACTIYARSPGLVVYEEFLNVNPRRKLRIGDRVFATQGIVTIPEVDRMLVEASVGEAEVHRVRPGQAATVRVEAFPDLRLNGKVSRVGTLASASATRPFDEKRFDLIVELDAGAAELRPEMTARADIVVGTRKDVLLIPVTAVFQKLGSPVAYVAGRGGFEARPIQLGESNERVVEVVGGLREHERVSLTEPQAAAGAARDGRPGNALQPR
jgi:HlyD family secretion protein